MFLNYLNKMKEYSVISGFDENTILKSPKSEFRYLCYFFLDIIRRYSLPKISLNHPFEAVLIEYRPLPHLEFLIRNMILKLGEGWSHTIICGNLNYLFIKDICDNISNNIKIIKSDYDNLNQSTYSEYLSKREFWEQFYGEKILIYQEDSCIFKENINQFTKWDYIGAPWPEHQNDNTYGVGNGGFSLRSKKCMLDVISKISIYDTVYNSSTISFIKNCSLSTPPEDVYFSLNMIQYQIGLVADREEANKFSSECILNEDSLGGHNFWLQNPLWREQFILNVFTTCVITSPYGLNIGGGESYLLHIAKFFILYKKCIILLCVDEEYEVKKNTICTILGEEFLPYFLFYSYSNHKQFYKKVNYHFDMSNSKIPSLEGLSKDNSNNYFHCQFPFDMKDIISESNKKIFYTYHKIILNSPFTKKYYMECMKNILNPNQKIHIIYPSSYKNMNQIMDSKLITLKEELSFVMVGRIFEYNPNANNKNFDVALECFEKISKKGFNNFSISIIGQVYDQKTLEKLKSYKIKNLYFYTNCSNEKKYEILKKSKYIINLTGINRKLDEEAYSFEHFGISIIEALICKCIPITINGGFPPYYINDKVNGYKVQSQKHLNYLLERIIIHQERLKNEDINFEEWISKFSEESFHKSLLNVN